MEKKQEKQYLVNETAIARLGAFLSELPYKYKDKIEPVVQGFNNIKAAEVKDPKDESAS